MASLLHFRLGNPEPENVHWSAQVLHWKHRADDRRAAVGRDGQSRAELLSVIKPHPLGAASALYEARNRGLHFERETRIRLCLVAQEIEEVPLRHHRDERRWRVEVRQVADRPAAATEAQLRTLYFVVRPLEEPLEHAQLVENLHRRWVDSVAAKIAEEVGVLFEHLDAAAGAGE